MLHAQAQTLHALECALPIGHHNALLPREVVDVPALLGAETAAALEEHGVVLLREWDGGDDHENLGARVGQQKATARTQMKALHTRPAEGD